jgi:hypothetical protein
MMRIVWMYPDFFELPGVAGVVYMTVRDDNYEQFVGYFSDCTLKIADAHPTVNHHSLFLPNQHKNAGTVKLVYFPSVFLELHHWI